MTRRIRLDDSSSQTVRLKTTSVDFSNAKERAIIHGKRGRSVENNIAAFDKALISSLIEDTETLLKALKKFGVKPERALHYSQTDEWKQSMKKGVKDSDVPAFLRPPKKARVKL